MSIAVMQEPAENLRIRLASVGNVVIDTCAPAQIEDGISASDLKVSYKAGVEVDRPHSKVNVDVTLIYLSGRKTLFSGSLTTVFDVVDLASFITEEEGEDGFRIESDFLPMLIGIAFSTTRGYFARDLQDTALAPYPFPIIPMDSIQKRTTYQLK